MPVSAVIGSLSTAPRAAVPTQQPIQPLADKRPRRSVVAVTLEYVDSTADEVSRAALEMTIDFLAQAAMKAMYSDKLEYHITPETPLAQ
jgi:hypothetical protein